MPSQARVALTTNLQDIDRLLQLHGQVGGTAPGRRHNLEVLNKSAIVLITSFWEAYCEDIASEALEHIVSHAPDANALPTEIKKLVSKDIKGAPNELEVWQLAGDGWRLYLRARLTSLRVARDRKLNTPKHANIDDLFFSTIGLKNATGGWNWSKKLTPQKAQQKLDKFVELRGEIAHRGNATVSVTKAKVQDYRDFIKQAASKTGGAVNKHVKVITGTGLY